MRASDAKVIQLMRKAALLIRRAGAATMSEGHRLSETNFPPRCSRCNQSWPCATERDARPFNRAAGELRASARHTVPPESFAAVVARCRNAPPVIQALDALANDIRENVPQLNYSPVIRAVLRATEVEST